MKHAKHLFFITTLCNVLNMSAHGQDFNVILQAQWQDLEDNEERAQVFGGKWILAGSITFKKKAKDTVHLSKLYLHWQGTHIDQLIASLYLGQETSPLIPIQENLICDGTWNKAQQTLILNFDKTLILGPTTIFNLVLTVPPRLEPVLKTGSFNLVTTCLPEPYKLCARDRSLSLASIKKKPPYSRSFSVAAK